MPRLETAVSELAFHDEWCLWSEECAALCGTVATPACARILAILAGDTHTFVGAPGTPIHALQTLLYREPLRTCTDAALLSDAAPDVDLPFPEACLRTLLAHGALHAIALATRRAGPWFAASIATLLLRPDVRSVFPPVAAPEQCDHSSTSDDSEEDEQ